MKKWIKSPLTISILTTIVPMLYDYSKEKPILTTILKIVKEIKNFVYKLFNFDLKVWWIILVALVFLIILNVIKVKPDFYSYREDVFKGWKWTWSWNKINGRWLISELDVHCPKCDTPMTINSGNYNDMIFNCPRCEFRHDDKQITLDKIEMIIIDNIKKKYSINRKG